MGNFVSFVKHALFSAVAEKIDHLAPTASEQEVSEWCCCFKQLVSQIGFERAFKQYLLDILQIADKHAALLPSAVADWLQADPTTASIVEQHRADTLSQQDLRAGRLPDGSSVFHDADADGVHGIVEKDGRAVKVFRGEPFRNWGDTLSFRTSYTFVPTTQVGVINVVKFALAERRRVRVSGSRHSWSPVFGSDGDIVISMMEIGAAVQQIRWLPPKDNPQDNELESVALDGTFIAEDGSRHARIRLGGAATSEHFRQWTLSNAEGGGDWQWMIRALPILTAITSGGWTQPICHGSGITHKSVSDLCVEMTIVNCKGELQTISDRQQLRAVAGSFGLFGVIVSHVFVMDPMKIAQLFPRKIPTMLSVPPVRREDVPQQDDFHTSFSDKQLQEAQRAFELDCNKFYCEWFWFPFQDECWLNSWDVTDVGEDRPVYPDEKEVELQNLQASIAWLFEVTLLRFLPGKVQASLFGWAAMFFLPTGNFPTSVSNALHFRRGIHRMPVRDVEVSIEIPAKRDGTPDFSICQKAWWHAISEVYESLEQREEAPMRTTLEMRIVGDSDILMSTQRGNTCGTCAIEVLTNTLVPDEVWKAFVERVVARWASLTNPVTGEPLRVKPHWAKEWPTTMRGESIVKYLRTTYRGDASEFVTEMEKAAADGGYELSDAFGVFGNDTILSIIDAQQ
ncbi:hypothetical protein BWQ96_04687 [Gracilariopsis chorda]|uniref:FAD-binding PCMH-type domain-containing protein n=1 Tax=Gracilariopsis chorda TaxID=448386 RepID=A0A2V3ITX7_9FLOR|nr:hypothetical protein BWQ96_04687 [Gracilariopsis chorda]|eukprot:PXF45549.1 hypothetical protein BWQ96_04687 [Gracilariopsis chorda]